VTRVALEIPKVGLVMENARLIRWLKNVGEVVAQGEPILELETEKSVVEIESTESGRLVEILLQADQEARVGDRVAWIENDTVAGVGASDARASPPPLTNGPGTAAVPTPVAAAGRLDTKAVPMSAGDAPSSPLIGGPDSLSPPTPVAAAGRSDTKAAPPSAAVDAPNVNNTGRIVSSPAARRLAATHALNLRQVEGTGPRGRVQMIDVRRAVDSRTAPESSAGATSGSPLLSGMRRALARAMTLSNATVPQFTVERAVDWTSLYRVRAGTPGKLQVPSINDFILQAMAATLLEFPALNATFSGDANSADASIVPASGAHVGLVVAVENGLLVPVLHGVEQLGLAELMRRRCAIVERALTRTLKREELEGATISLSNLGARGPDRFNALINPPQSAILAVGRQANRVVALNGGVHVRPVSQLTLTVDHRVADGRLASDFLAFLVDILEGDVWRVN
jgi:pyruvate dehydrogenase E2 component (dihydrolipoamide acetyltransferase)